MANLVSNDIRSSIESLDQNDLNFLEQKLEIDKTKPKNGMLLLLIIAFIMPVIPRGGKMMIDSMNYSTAVLILVFFFSLVSIYLYYEMIIKLKKEIRLNKKIRYIAIIKKKEKSFFKKKNSCYSYQLIRINIIKLKLKRQIIILLKLVLKLYLSILF
jgi:gamma-glutamyl phosphate reductase